jgi:chromosome segregation ATPase
MNDPQSEARPGADAVAWLHEQVTQLKTQVGRMTQQGDQTQAAILDVNEKLRDAEARLREIGAKTVGLPVMQDQLRQLAGLMERIQDAEVLIDTKFEMIERLNHDAQGRDQSEKNDLYRRVQELERRAEGLGERQAMVDDALRRFQDEVSRSHLQYQGINQRLESVESKTGRNVDAVNRLEQTHSETEQGIRALRREDDVLAERVRLAHEVAGRLETDMHAQQEEYRVLPLLTERVELLRAERQRLEDRASRLEESLEDARTRLEREEDFTAHVDVRIKTFEARLDHVHSSTLDYRRTLNEHLLKMNQMLERMKRREVEEIERQVKELRVQANLLKNEDDVDG